MTGLAVVVAPLAAEQAALAGGRTGLRVCRGGMGPARAAATAATLRAAPLPLVVAGVGGGLDPALRPGDVVVATEVRGAGTPVPVPSAPLLAGALARLGLPVRLGPVLSTPGLVDGAVRDRLARTGALAVDMESAHLAVLAADRPFAVLRAVVDTPGQPLRRLGTAGNGITALRALRRARPALAWWAAATGPREVLLATHGRRPVPTLAHACDLVLVLGSDTAAARRLAELATRAGVPAYPVENPGDVDLRWLAGTRRIGVTAATDVSPDLVDALVRGLCGLGPVTVRHITVRDEDIRFTVPREVT